MNSTKFKVEDIFGDVISKDSFSQEQIIKPNKLLSQINVNIIFCMKINLFEPRKKKNLLIINRVLLLPNIVFSK